MNNINTQKTNGNANQNHVTQTSTCKQETLTTDDVKGFLNEYSAPCFNLIERNQIMKSNAIDHLNTTPKLITVIYVDVKCQKVGGTAPMWVYQHTKDNPYAMIYDLLAKTVEKDGRGRLCNWNCLSGGNNSITYLINCWDKDSEALKKVIESAINSVTELQIIGVEIAEEPWEDEMGIME